MPLQIIPTSAVLDQFGFVRILDMNSPTSQIPHDCAETVDGSLDGDGGARCFAGTQLGSGGWQGLHLGLAPSTKFNERSS